MPGAVLERIAFRPSRFRPPAHLVGSRPAISDRTDVERETVLSERVSLPGGPGGMFGWLRQAGADSQDGGGGNGGMAKTVRYDWAQAGRDIALLVALREARQRVLDRLAGLATDRAAFERLAAAQRDLVFLVAEFFYALRALGIASPEGVAAFIAQHNAQIEKRLEGELKARVGGFADRLKEGRFGPGAVRMIQVNLAQQGRLELSRSDIARFLVEVMSDETCRKVLTGLTQAGLLKSRREELNRSIMVWSEGALEEAFGQHLAEIRAIVMAPA